MISNHQLVWGLVIDCWFGDSIPKRPGRGGGAPSGVWWAEPPHEPGGFGGWSPPSTIFFIVKQKNNFAPILVETGSKYVSEDSKKKYSFPKIQLFSEIIYAKKLFRGIFFRLF